jgi:thermitase
LGENSDGEKITERIGRSRFQIKTMSKVCSILYCLVLAFALSAGAAETNSFVWHKTEARMDADVRGETLLPLLEKIAVQTGWRVYVEPGTERTVSAKFKNLPSSEALRMLLGDLNFELSPQTNAVARLYVFTTKIQNATRLVRAAKPAGGHVADELLVKVKPGTDIDALAKMLGAKITGRLDKSGIYRLQFSDAATTDAALAQLQKNSDVADAGYNYILDPPPSAQAISSAPVPPLSLQLNPPGDSGKIIVGLPDMAVQSLGAQLDKFILPQLSVAGVTPADNSDITHGTAMAYTILQAIAQASGGSSSVQILPVDIYGGGETTTSWNVATGIQQAVDHGANVLNLSLGGVDDSSILDGVIQQAIADGIPVFAAAGNQPVSTATYPAADPGVIAVTATQNGKIASYADYGSFVDLAIPGASVVYFGNQAYVVQGTSVSTANATGLAAGTKGANGASWAQIEAALQKKFAVPSK